MLLVIESRNGRSLKRSPFTEYATTANRLTASTIQLAGVADGDEVRDERQGEDPGCDERRPVPARFQQRALDTALARVAQVGLVVEDVVDAVHREVVRHQEEERADHEGGVDAPGRHEVRGREREGRVDPAQRPAGEEERADHGAPVVE